MKSEATSVAHYFEELPAERKAALTELRGMVRRVVPEAAESMQHGMAAYELNGLFCALASQKKHMAIYICETDIVEKHRGSLGKLDCGKGCIRFRKLEDVLMKALETIVTEAAAKRRQ